MSIYKNGVFSQPWSVSGVDGHLGKYVLAVCKSMFSSSDLQKIDL